MTATFHNVRTAALIAEGLDPVQAHHVARAEGYMKNNVGRNARHGDYRFGKEF